MTQEDRELLERTAAWGRSALGAIERFSGGLEAALLEIYRAQFVSNDRKLETLSRLRVVSRVLEEEGHGAGFISRFIEKLERWSRG